MRWGLVLVVVAACGRSGFDLEVDAARTNTDATVDPTGDGGVLDPIDAPPGSAVVKFGETPTSNITGVTSDTYIDGEVGATGNNYGASTGLAAEGTQDHALLKFTLTAIPAGKTILAARLHLYSQASIAGPGIIYAAAQDWTEGSGTGQAGVANWTMRTASASWSTAGGSLGAQIATFTTPGTGVFGVDLPVATVQGWVNTPTSNFGLVIVATGSNNDLAFASSNSATTTNRPELVVTYTP